MLSTFQSSGKGDGGKEESAFSFDRRKTPAGRFVRVFESSVSFFLARKLGAKQISFLAASSPALSHTGGVQRPSLFFPMQDLSEACIMKPAS